MTVLIGPKCCSSLKNIFIFSSRDIRKMVAQTWHRIAFYLIKVLRGFIYFHTSHKCLKSKTLLLHQKVLVIQECQESKTRNCKACYVEIAEDYIGSNSFWPGGCVLNPPPENICLIYSAALN